MIKYTFSDVNEIPYHHYPKLGICNIKKGKKAKKYIKLEGRRHSQAGHWVRQNYVKIRNLVSD